MEQRVDFRGDSSMSQSLAGAGFQSPVALFATYAARREDLDEWLSGASINRDRDLRMQYLAGRGRIMATLAVVSTRPSNTVRLPP